MDSFDKMFKKEHVGQNVLAVLFIVYLIMGYKTPEPVAGMIDTTIGKIVVVLVAVLLFAYANPILGVLGLFVAFDLIRRSSLSTGTYALEKYMPTEAKKYTELTQYNQFPYTLEEEMVKKMAPTKYVASDSTQVHFSPILDDTHDAAPINYTGVI